MRSFFIMLLLLASVGSTLIAQKKFTNPERAITLKNQFKDAKLVATKSETVYEFILDDGNLVINQKDEVDLITLQSNVKYRRPVFYNDHIKIKSGNAKYSSGRGFLKTDKVCGNYEVEDIFYTDAKVCSYFLDILYEASEVSFSSEKEYDDAKYFNKVFFHDQEPTKSRKITFIIPLEVEVELIEMNFAGFQIEKSIVEESGKQIYTYTIENIDELKSEANSLGYLYQYPHILVLTKSYSTGADEVTVISKVDDLYNWYSKLVSEVDIDKQALSDQVSKLTADASSDEEKIRNIYYWVQENIKYIAFEDGIAGFKPEAPQEVYQNRYGDCKGMAILTKTMLQIAGFDARLTWIGTNKIPYNYDHPTLAVDNHMICTVFHQDKQYILDATEKYIALGEHAERIQGKEMLIENGSEFIRKNVPVESAEKNLIERKEKLKLEGETLIGTGELFVKGEAKKLILFISTNSKVKEKDKLYDFLSVSDYNNDDLVKVDNIPETDRDLPLKVAYNYKLNNHVSSFDNEYFIDLDWEKKYKSLKIEEDRVSDYYFGRKVKNRVVKEIEIPKNFKITHLPVQVTENYKDITINVKFEQKGNVITYTNEIVVGSGKILKADFDKWNELIQKLRTVYDDQIVITKIS